VHEARRGVGAVTCRECRRFQPKSDESRANRRIAFGARVGIPAAVGEFSPCSLGKKDPSDVTVRLAPHRVRLSEAPPHQPQALRQLATIRLADGATIGPLRENELRTY